MDKKTAIARLVMDLAEQLAMIPERDIGQVGAHLLGVVNGVRIAETVRAEKTA